MNANSKEDEQHLTTEELAKRWGIHKVTLARWRQAGEGPKYIKLGNSSKAPILYRIVDVIEHENQYLVE